MLHRYEATQITTVKKSNAQRAIIKGKLEEAEILKQYRTEKGKAIKELIENYRPGSAKVIREMNINFHLPGFWPDFIHYMKAKDKLLTIWRMVDDQIQDLRMKEEREYTWLEQQQTLG